jgi:hypothetical protein
MRKAKSSSTAAPSCSCSELTDARFVEPFGNQPLMRISAQDATTIAAISQWSERDSVS